MLVCHLAAPQRSLLAKDLQFVKLQSQVAAIAESLHVLVTRGAAPVPPVDTNVGRVVGGSGSQPGITQEDLTNIYKESSGDESEDGHSGYSAFTGADGLDQWFMPKTNWRPFWDEQNKVAFFCFFSLVMR